jgi:natural product precursor
MKTKKISNKFGLNKQTVVSLSNLEMDHLKGGLPPSCSCGGYGAYSCPPWDSCCTVYCEP